MSSVAIAALVLGERFGVQLRRQPGPGPHQCQSAGGLMGSLAPLHAPPGCEHPALHKRGQAGVVRVGRGAPTAGGMLTGEPEALPVLSTVGDGA